MHTRPLWREVCRDRVARFEEGRIYVLEEKSRHLQGQIGHIPSGQFACDEIRRVSIRIGLTSHSRLH
ncbi:unnamed protein product [Anisakis simplex]|uniref:Transposase n=1 Tax=Anisakis simplex TaxID=6269 RepID=A0A0M3JVV4_ANISI|nr:unnamed protein product [Anisakis simplex]